MGQSAAIVILFILVAVVAYSFYKHKKDTNAHKPAIPTPTTPAPIGGAPGSGGGNAGDRPRAEQK